MRVIMILVFSLIFCMILRNYLSTFCGMNIHERPNYDFNVLFISDDGEYLAFGVSGNPNSLAMIGGDVTAVWRRNGVAVAEDYYMRGYSLVRNLMPCKIFNKSSLALYLTCAIFVVNEGNYSEKVHDEIQHFDFC